MRFALSILIAFIMTLNMFAYNVETDSVAYKIFLWKNGDLKTAKEVVGYYKDIKSDTCEHQECSVKVSKRQDDDNTEWRISVTPKGDWGVAEVRYPMLFLPTLKNAFLIEPKRIGQRIPMSYFTGKRTDRLPGNAMRTEMCKYPELRNKKVFNIIRYPTKACLQMVAYENDREGVMIWTKDKGMHVKDFCFSYDDLDNEHRGRGIRVYIAQFPDNTGQKGTGYNSPYPVVTTPYKGGWYTAALIYKAWADKQWWVAKKKIYDRKNTPEWYKDFHLSWCVAGKPGWVRKQIDRLWPYIKGHTVGSQLMNWGRYQESNTNSIPQFMPARDEKGFKNNIDFKHKGLYFAPYFMFSAVCDENVAVYDKLKSGEILFPDGTVPKMYWSPINAEKVAESGPAGKSYPKPIVEYAKKIVAYKDQLRKAFDKAFDEKLINRLDEFQMNDDIRELQKAFLRKKWGKDKKVIDTLKFYVVQSRTCLADKKFADYCIDQVCECIQKYDAPAVYFDTFPHSILPCYNKDHGHPLGYGEYFIKATRNFLHEIKKRHPKVIFFCESGGGEPYLDCMHVAYFKGIKPQYAIPLFPVVYNGYLDWTSWWMWPPYDTIESYTSNLAFGLHNNYIPGGAIAGGVLSQLYRQMEVPVNDFKVKYLLETSDIRKRYRDYIASGRRLYNPVVKGVKPKEVEWSIKTGNYQFPVLMKPVLASLWAHRDNPHDGLLLVSNWSENPQTVTIEGRTMILQPFEWSAEKIYIDDINNCKVRNEEYVTHPQRKTDIFGAKDTIFGRIMEIDETKKNIVVTYLTGNGKKTQKTFFITNKTEYENIASFSDLKLGQMVDVIFLDTDKGAQVKKIILDIKGDKEEQG